MERFWIALVVYGAGDTLASWLTARWVHGSGRAWCVAAFVAYAACAIAWLIGLGGERNPGVARASAVYPIVAMFAGVGAGYAVGERLGVKGWLGVMLGCAAVALVASESSAKE